MTRSKAGRPLGIGLIGTGFMGRAHALAYRSAGAIFEDVPHAELCAVADADAGAAERARAQHGFARATADWRDLLADDTIDIVSITTPTLLHAPMALAAIAAGKHVHCEKPLAENCGTAERMMRAAAQAGIRTQTGYSYLKNPMLALARDMIEDGALGTITGFRGIHAEGFMADPTIAQSWRTDPAGGGGAIADLGSHIIGMARFLLGPITELACLLDTVVTTRPVAPHSPTRQPVLVDDTARLLVRFARGMSGTIEASWVATGRTMQLGFEVSGSKGALVFSQERLNELHFYEAAEDPQRAGFRRIEAGPAHPPYRSFCVAPGHQLGFNDLKTIEIAEFLRAIDSGAPNGPDFAEAWEIQKVIDTAIAASRTRNWHSVS